MRFLVLFLLLPLLHICQTDGQKTFSLKPSLGINGCQVHGDNYSGYHKLGLFAGTAVNAKINLRSSLELGFYFSQKGARHNQNPKSGDYSFYRLNLNYIDLPLSYRFIFHPDYFVTGGLSFAYLINYNENINNANMSAYSNFNKTEIGLNGGIGRRIKNGLSVELRTCNSIVAIRNYGQAATLVYYNNPIARFFNKGFYNNLLSLFFTYQLGQQQQSGKQKT
ncbi:MAG: PorT family protein [Bacteroidia bacterium]|nr:PorT family protein [Bacteroidia bacterium]